MAQLDILDIFEDCVNRLSAGQSVDDCLIAYPDYAARLRPMLETTQTVQTTELVSIAEQNEDIPIIWDLIQQKQSDRVPIAVLPRRRSRNIRIQLLIAIILLSLLTFAAWFVLSRPNQNDTIVPIEETFTPTQTITEEPEVIATNTLEDITPSLTYTSTSTLRPTATTTSTPSSTMTSTPTLSVTPSMTSTLTMTPSPTSTPTATPSRTHTPTPTATQTVTPSPTKTLVPSETPLPTATFVPGCGAPTSITDATNTVMSIYPNTSIISVEQVTRFGGRLVWEIETSHGIEVTIDVGCGHILTIERNNNVPTVSDDTNSNTNLNTASNENIDNSGGGSSTTNPTANNNNSGGSSNSNSNNNDNNSNDNDNDNDDDDNSNDNKDDDSGMGSDDD